ncbi:MAG: class I SAM-dependent methyltransferase [Solirubrobacteraceae bacterium]
MAPEPDEKLHSAEFFGPERDYWWNRDHLELIASRLNLDAVRTVLDVGCGVGHWGRLLASVLTPEATIVGVDPEPNWITQATTTAGERRLDGRIRYVLGLAEELPFADATFDLVTCQTLLIHVVSPRAVLEEMLRVARPGGLILAAEPNNRASLLIDASTDVDASIDDLLERVRFALTCERGKISLGEGNISIGDLVPGYLAELGATDLRTFIADRAAMLVPPYESDAQQALADYALQEAAHGTWGWDRADAHRYFLAGGGTGEGFDIAWDRRFQENRLRAQAIQDGSFHTAGGNVLYAIAGTKPARGA